MPYDMNLALLIIVVMLALSARTTFRFLSKNDKAKEAAGSIAGNVLKRWLK